MIEALRLACFAWLLGCGRTEPVGYSLVVEERTPDGGRRCDFEAHVDALLSVTADNQRTVFVNGAQVEATVKEWYQPAQLTVALWRHPGRENVIAVRAANLSNQAGLDRGLLLDLRLGGQVWVSDRQWRQAGVNDGGWDDSDPSWTRPGFDDSRWGAAVEQAKNGAAPWGLIGLVDPQAQWIWPYLSSTAVKPELEPVLFRRVVYISLDGGFSSRPAPCP